MGRPIELTGVIHGNTITLDGETCVPDGHRVTLHLILTPEEAMEFSFGSWADMPPEVVADFEQYMSEELGKPYKMPEPDDL